MSRPRGTPKTGGRVKGTPNRRTSELIEAGRETAMRVLGEDAFAGDAYALLEIVFRDPAQPWDRRVDAAKAVLPYERPRLMASAVVSKHIDGDDAAFGQLFAQIEQRLALAPPSARAEVIDMLREDEE